MLELEKAMKSEKIAFKLLNANMSYIPILIKLNRYNGESIMDMIPEEYKGFENEKLVLLLDGYDEIESTKISDFGRAILSYSDKNSESLVLITSRSNFYTNEVDKKTKGTFEGYYEIKFKPIDNAEIEIYLEKMKTDILNFYSFVREVDAQNLVYNPFYLSELVQLFHEDNRVTSRGDLMRRMIKRRFLNDGSKFNLSMSLEDIEYDIHKQLKIIAFSLQLMKKNTISNLDYQRMLDFQFRQILNYNGVWSKDSERMWSFVHNNFREYLVAELLSDLTLDDTINVITYKHDRTKIKSSWSNVISFLLSIEYNEDFVNWLLSVDPSILIKFEPEHIAIDTRSDIVINIIENFKLKNMWFNIDGISLEEIISFGEGKSLLVYLLSEIRSSLHFRSEYNALASLSCFRNTYGLKDKILDELFLCLESHKTRNHEKKEAIRCLSKLEIANDVVHEKLLSLFTNDYNEEIRYGMYRYFIELDLCDRYMDYFIDGLKEKASKNRIGSFVSEYMALEEGIKMIKSSDALKKLIKFFIDLNRDNSIYHEKELIETLVEKATQFYLKDHLYFLNLMIQLYLSNYHKYLYEYNHVLMNFF